MDKEISMALYTYLSEFNFILDDVTENTISMFIMVDGNTLDAYVHNRYVVFDYVYKSHTIKCDSMSEFKVEIENYLVTFNDLKGKIREYRINKIL